jgi:SAM-dependent methyltransferase
MNTNEAVALLRGAVPPAPGTWADIGAGNGTFSRALLALLGPSSRLYAVDRDEGAVAAIRRGATRDAPNVTVVHADFTQSLTLPGLEPSTLDGMLLANALHFVRDAGTVLARLVTHLRPGGRVVLIEYDRRRASPWVPYPIPSSSLPALAAAACLTAFIVTATRASLFGGVLYVAAADAPHRQSSHGEAPITPA